jgi:hypothetical protein
MLSTKQSKSLVVGRKPHSEETKRKISQSLMLRKETERQSIKDNEFRKAAEEAYHEELAAQEKAKEDAKIQPLVDEHLAEDEARIDAIERESEEIKKKEGVEIMTFLDACNNAESAARQAFKETCEKKYGVDSETTQRLYRMFISMSYNSIDIKWRR